MIFEIPSSNNEDKVKLTLETTPTGDVMLCARKGYIKDYILRLRANGHMHRPCGVTPSLGFRLDTEGRVLFEGESSLHSSPRQE